MRWKRFNWFVFKATNEAIDIEREKIVDSYGETWRFTINVKKPLFVRRMTCKHPKLGVHRYCLECERFFG